MNAAVHACQKGQQWEAALALLSVTLKQAGADIITFGSAISACAQGGQWTWALWLNTLLRGESNVLVKARPNTTTYNATISAMERGQQWERALELLHDMMCLAIRTTVVSYNSIMSAMEKGHQWERSLQLLRLLQQVSHEPTIISYNAAISACQKSERAMAAMLLFEEMERWRLMADVVSHNAVISACEQGSRWEAGLHLFHRMRARGPPPDLITLNAAVSVCEKSVQWEAALLLVSEMLLSPAPRPGLVAFSSALLACEHGEKWRASLQLWSLMLANHCSPNTLSARAISGVVEISQFSPIVHSRLHDLHLSVQSYMERLDRVPVEACSVSTSDRQEGFELFAASADMLQRHGLSGSLVDLYVRRKAQNLSPPLAKLLQQPEAPPSISRLQDQSLINFSGLGGLATSELLASLGFADWAKRPCGPALAQSLVRFMPVAPRTPAARRLAVLVRWRLSARFQQDALLGEEVHVSGGLAGRLWKTSSSH